MSETLTAGNHHRNYINYPYKSSLIKSINGSGVIAFVKTLKPDKHLRLKLFVRSFLF